MLRKIHPAGRNVSGHVPENLWKLSVNYLFKDTDFLLKDYKINEISQNAIIWQLLYKFIC